MSALEAQTGWSGLLKGFTLVTTPSVRPAASQPPLLFEEGNFHRIDNSVALKAILQYAPPYGTEPIPSAESVIRSRGAVPDGFGSVGSGFRPLRGTPRLQPFLLAVPDRRTAIRSNCGFAHYRTLDFD